MKKITILGSTGSIGTQALEVIGAQPDARVTALCAGSDVQKLETQIRRFHPALACLYDEAAAADLSVRVADTHTRVLSGMEGLVQAAAETDADIVLAAIVGMIGIRPTLAAIEAGKDIALANKETLVTAGHLVMGAAKRKGVRILPVDSEHSAVFQCLQGNDGNRISRLLLTASGGPFRGKTRGELARATVEQALAHPNWSMGRKITVDSATLVNKGLEVLEANRLFDVPLSRIEVVVQPKSVIHSMVEFEDGAVMAQLGTPDMKIPIAYALFYPERRQLPGGRLDFAAIRSIELDRPDTENFPALDLAYEAGRAGGTMTTVFNAANEWAVAQFLEGELGFNEITDTIARAMAAHTPVSDPSLSQILETERELTARLSAERKGK